MGRHTVRGAAEKTILPDLRTYQYRALIFAPISSRAEALQRWDSWERLSHWPTSLCATQCCACDAERRKVKFRSSEQELAVSPR